MYYKKVLIFLCIIIILPSTVYIGHSIKTNARKEIFNNKLPTLSNNSSNIINKPTHNQTIDEYDITNDYEVISDMYDNNEVILDLEPNSITALINKEYGLPSDYIPEDLEMPNVLFDEIPFSEKKLLRTEAARALEGLFNRALKEDIELYAVSGYRSYKRQYEIFTKNLRTKGKTHTLKYSAIPGTSEHQSGLTMDVSCKSINFRLIESFEDTPEGIWLSNNSHHFGFIIRYPKDKVDITGYAYEPWHIRYVGKSLATFLYKNSLSLEEYYQYEPSSDFNFEEKYADILYIPTPTPTPTPTPIEEDIEEEEGLSPEDSNDTITVDEDEVDISKDKDKDKDKDKPKEEIPDEIIDDNTDDLEESDNDDFHEEEDNIGDNGNLETSDQDDIEGSQDSSSTEDEDNIVSP